MCANVFSMAKASRRNRRQQQRRRRPYRPPIPFVARPFEGLAIERDLVAMREIIPAAVLPARTNGELGDVEFDFVTLLPNGIPAMVREDGRILVGLQTRTSSPDLSHDLGGALKAAVEMADKGGTGNVTFDVRDPAPRLQDVVAEEFLVSEDDSDEMFLELEPDFSYWFTEEEAEDADTQMALTQSREEIVPTEEVPASPGMYWCEMNNNFVRYLTQTGEDELFTALARLQVSGDASMGENSKFVGAFRAAGIAIPVFQVDNELSAEELEEPAAAFHQKLSEALENTEPLDHDEKRARAGLVSRQVTIR